jgi:hypothetical protein
VTSPAFDFTRAREASAEASRDQQAAEDQIGEKTRAYAAATEAYRKALALKTWELRREGVAWTSCGDLARGDAEVAALARARDEAEGYLQIATHAAYRRSADRRDTERFITWSMNRDLAEFHGRVPEDVPTGTFGGRRGAA